LNFGDCFGYALATATGEPLLYKGNDFTHTDITAGRQRGKRGRDPARALINPPIRRLGAQVARFTVPFRHE
jgi:hypothetical protein